MAELGIYSGGAQKIESVQEGADGTCVKVKDHSYGKPTPHSAEN